MHQRVRNRRTAVKSEPIRNHVTKGQALRAADGRPPLAGCMTQAQGAHVSGARLVQQRQTATRGWPFALRCPAPVRWCRGTRHTPPGVVLTQHVVTTSQVVRYNHRDDRIRTCDPLNPIQVRYRAAPHPVAESKPANRLKNIILATASNQWAAAGFRFLERARPRPRTTWDYRPPAPIEFA